MLMIAVIIIIGVVVVPVIPIVMASFVDHAARKHREDHA
jgi:hypothetical protein